MRRPNRRPNYLELGDVANYEGHADYIIYKDGSNTKVLNGNTGVVDSTSTNSTTAIQYAIDALATGGKLFIRAGAYAIGTAITIDTDDLEIIGQKGAILTTTAAIHAIEIGTTRNANKCIISGFELEGNGTGTVGIYVKTMTRSYIRDMEISSFTIWGIELQALHSIYVTGCFIDGNGTLGTAPYSGGITVGHDGPPDYVCNATTIEDCVIENNVTGIWVVTGVRIKIDKCTIEGQSKNGVVVDRQGVAATLPTNIYISAYFEANNTSTSATIYDIKVYGATKNVEIANCYFVGTDVDYGVYAGAGGYAACFSMHDCYFQSAGDNYFSLSTMMGGHVWGNGFADTTPRSGIVLSHLTSAWFHDNDNLENIHPVAAAHSIRATDRVLLVDATGGVRTATLPSPTKYGEPYTVKKVDASGNAVIVSQYNTDTIDGAATVALAGQYDYVTVKSDGTNWWIIGQG